MVGNVLRTLSGGGEIGVIEKMMEWFIKNYYHFRHLSHCTAADDCSFSPAAARADAGLCGDVELKSIKEECSEEEDIFNLLG